MDPKYDNIHFNDTTFSYTIKNQEQEPPAKKTNMTSSQLNIISKALKEVHLDPRNAHHLDISLLSNDSFRVVIDNKTVINIHKGTVSIPTQGIENKTFKSITSSVKNVFKAIANLFYKPSFPHPALKERTADQAILQDYRSLRKGLQGGSAWIADANVGEGVKKELSESIKRSQRIESALRSRSPRKSVEKLTGDFTSEVQALAPRESLTIPLGYRNKDGALQPVMLRFTREANNRLLLEIFADHAEAGARIQPSQLRRFQEKETPEDIFSVLNLFMQPLLLEGSQSTLDKMGKGSATFGALYGAVREQKMKELAPEYQVPSDQGQAAKVPESSVPSSFGYDHLMATVDGCMQNHWQPVAKAGKLVAPSSTATDRVTKWLNHLAGETLSPEKKNHLLLFLTEKWVKDLVRQIDSKSPLSAQLEIYQDCLEQIDHTMQKVIGRGGGESLPADLAGLKKLSEQKIAEIQPLMRRQQVEASQESLNVAMTHSLNIPVSPLSVTAHDELPTQAARTPVNLQGVNRAREALADVLSPENLRKHQINGALAGLIPVLNPLNPSEPPTTLEKTVLLILKANQAPLEGLYNHLRRGYRYKEGAFEHLAQFIANPQELHYQPDSEFENWIHVLREIDNPQKLIPPQFSDAVNVLRTVRSLHQLRGLEPLADDRIAAAEANIKELQGELTANLTAAAQECRQLIQASYAEPNLERKKRLLQEAQEQAVEVLRLLPSPGNHTAFHETSLWSQMPDPAAIQDNVFSLQQVIWESQMKLSQTDLPAMAQFQLIKGQAIQQALLLETSGLPSAEAFVMDAQEANKFLSQDLTRQLSADPRFEKDLVSLYEFISSSLDPQFNTKAIGKKVTEIDSKTADVRVKADYNRLLLASHMCRISRDPDFTLYSENAVLGVPFMTAKPDFLLNQGAIQLVVEGAQISIKNNAQEELAEVFLLGKAWLAYDRELESTYTESERDLLIREKVPFLPVVDDNALTLEGGKEDAARMIPDIRCALSFDQWMQYVAEKSRTTALAIPPAALTKLFHIRQSFPDSDNKYVLTSYHPDTALRAVAFLADPANTKYLEHDFVQTFISESLFGSFLMQQALSEYANVMVGHLEQLEARIEQSKDRPEVQSYLLGVLSQMRGHARARVESWEEQGMLSGMINGSLPNQARKVGGVLARIGANFKRLENLSSSVTEPGAFRMEGVRLCSNKLDEILGSYEDQKLRLNLFKGIQGKRPIDAITNPASRQQHFHLLLGEYRRDLADGSLEDLAPEHFTAIFFAAQGLEDPEMQFWIHREILPRFQAMPQESQCLTLTALLNETVKPPITQTNWVNSPDNPSQYRLNTSTRDFEVDLYQFDGLAPEGSKRSKTHTAIPDAILQRDDIRKALRTDRIMAQETKGKGQVTYTWSQGGQDFSLKVIGSSQVHLTRTINGVDYTYQPVPLDIHDSSAETLLAEHGMWVSSQGARIFTNGMAVPSRLDTFAVQREGNKVINVQTVGAEQNEGHYISATSRTDHPSPLLVAKADQVITILRGDQAVEMRIQNSPLRLVREGDGWNCLNGEVVLGKLQYPADEKAMIDAFGSHWDQFVTPLKKTDGTSAFAMIPYPQSVNRQGNMQVDQSASKSTIEVLNVLPDGQIKGSVTAHLYLAHERLLEASKAKTPETGRALSLQAQKHLDILGASRPSTSADDAQNLLKVTEMLRQSPTVTLKPMPTADALAMALRLGLQARRMCKMAKLPLSTSAKFAETETLSLQFRAYEAMRRSGEISAFGQGGKVSKQLLLLSDKERLELSQIQESLLTAAVAPTSLKEFFGGEVGTFETTAELSRAKHLDPQFLLALLRTAKPVSDPPMDIREVSAPIPLDMLMENFWNYFASIKEHKLSPDQLAFLFSPSVMPPSRNPEEAELLATIDKQARQFLLAAADLEVAIGQDINPMETLDQALTAAKSKINDYLTEEALVLVGDLDVKVRTQFTDLRDSLENLEGEAVPVEIGGKTIQFVNVPKLTSDINALEVQISNLASSVASLITQAESAADALDSEYRALTDSLAELRSKAREQTTFLKEAKPEQAIEFEVRLTELQKQIELKEKEIENYLQESIKAPLSGDDATREELVNGAFLEAVGVPQLQEIIQSCEAMRNRLVGARMNALQAEKGFKFWSDTENFTHDIKKLKYTPQPNLRFPEEGPAAANLLQFLAPGGQLRTLKPNVATAKELLQKVGPVEGSRLAVNTLGGLKKKIMVFAPLLESLAAYPEAAHKTDAFKLGEKTFSADLPLPIEIAEKASRYLSESQRENLAAHLQKIAPGERKNYLQTLAEALDQHEEFIATQTSLESQLSYIEGALNRIAEPNRIKPDGDPPTVVRRDTFNREFSAFFSNALTFNPKAFSEKEWNQIGQALSAIAKNEEWQNRLSLDLLRNPSALPVLEILGTIEGGLRLPTTTAEANTILASLTRTASAKSWGTVADILVSSYPTLARQVHEAKHSQLISDLMETVPEDDTSSYANDLRTGINGLKDNSPLPYTPKIRSEYLTQVRTRLEARIETTTTLLEAQEKRIVDTLIKVPIASLPTELQRIRLRKGSSRELLDTAFKLQRRGAFDPKIFPSSPTLDLWISESLTDATMLKQLQGAKTNALQTLTTLDSLLAQKQELETQLRQAPDADQASNIHSQLKAIEAKWTRESSKLQDTLQRCQNTAQLNALSPALKPHARKVIYLQYRLGLVLREDQLKALEQLIVNPSLLMQMRMGLGKTSILVPFALEILASEGYNAIGIVPQSQFHSNFDEMDETTRLVFELAGSKPQFSRQDLPQPLTTKSIQSLSEKCKEIFEAFEAGEYILTTIQSKASLDDKITEVEMAHAKLQQQLDDLEEEAPTRDPLYTQVMQHQAALDILYRLKDVFELKNSRLIIDEADSVARATYSVNAEMGKKAMPETIIRETVSQLFQIIRSGAGKIEKVKNEIFENNQFTLTETEVNAFLKAVGEEWINQSHPNLQNKERILDWLVGGPSPYNAQEIQDLGPSLKTELKVLRKALNSGLRGSLALKVGLSTDYDPIRKAIGVPAQQGITSASTKYSDPLMQLCLANMIAMYTPQGEEFLLSAAGEVHERVNELAKKADEDSVIKVASHNLGVLLARRKEDPTVSLTKELSGREPWKVLLRAEFADQTALQQLIYVSDSQISRPVQHTLRGCNVIGLTGTATRNLTKVIESNGNANGMDSVTQSGRTTTAEVLYRLASASPQGLQTPVKTYSMQNDEALQQLAGFAKKESGYNFIINQAAVCDHKSQREIVETLHASDGRPIVFLDLTTDKKCALIHGKTVPLEQLSTEEKKQVRQEGLYYYPAPHTRGTHFDIPTGSKGALLLSPTVNADDRDQAAYRARELGEGHTVECFISQKQHKQIEESTGSTPKLKDVLKTNFHQTKTDEGVEDLAAYRLHLQGLLTLAADKAKLALQLNSPVAQIGAYSNEEVKETFVATSQQKALLFSIFKRFFVESTNNEAYLEQLDREMRQGGEEPTQESLVRAVKGQIRLANHLKDSLLEAEDQLGPAYQLAIIEIEKAEANLKVEKKVLFHYKLKHFKQLKFKAMIRPDFINLLIPIKHILQQHY